MGLRVLDMSIGDNNSLEQDRVSFTKTGGRFSAAFIKGHDFRNHQSFRVHVDDDKPYKIIFEVVEEKNAPNSKKLRKDGEGCGRVFALNAIKEEFKTVETLIKLKHSVHTHSFEIHALPHSKNYFYCDIIPMFEQTRSWEDRNSIPSKMNGIYKYLNHEDTVIYIGMGNIKERTSESDRKDWGIKTIQFSEVVDFSEHKRITKEYESTHMQNHKKMNDNNLPIHNFMNGVRT